jgi:hypothetical protein
METSAVPTYFSLWHITQEIANLYTILGLRGTTLSFLDTDVKSSTSLLFQFLYDQNIHILDNSFQQFPNHIFWTAETKETSFPLHHSLFANW